MAGQQDSRQIYGIDFLRFFAASLVMVYHFGFVSWAAPGNGSNSALYDGDRSLASFVGTGWVGVEIFFVISGFVIAYTANGASPLKFLNRRILRLGPAVWICATLSIPFLLADGVGLRESLFRFFASVMFLPYFTKVAGSYWTLPVEITFYGFILVLLCANLFRRIEWATLLLGYGSSLVWVLYSLRPWIHMGALGDVVGLLGDKMEGQLLLTQYGVFFALGLMMWLVSVYGWTVSRAAAIGTFIIAGVLEIAAETAKSSAWTGYHESAAVPIALWLAAMISIAVSIKYNGLIERIFGQRRHIIRTIGLVTYPLYLVHEPAGAWVQFKLLEFGQPAMVCLVLAAGFSMALASVIAIWLEPMLQNRVRKLIAMVEVRRPARFDRLSAATALAPAQKAL